MFQSLFSSILTNLHKILPYVFKYRLRAENQKLKEENAKLKETTSDDE